MVISKDFIYGTESFYESGYVQNINNINRIMEDYDARVMQQTILTGFGMFAEAQDDSFIESAVNTVRKLGEKILEIIAKLKQFISDCAANLRGAAIKRQALGKDMIRIEAKNPELAGKIKVAITAGDINFSTMKGISDYYKEIDRIVDDIEKNKLDPNSFKGRLERARKVLLNNKETITTISSVIGMVSTISALYINWNHHQSFVTKEKRQIDELSNQSMLVLDRTEKLAKKLQSLPAEKRPVTPMGFYAKIVAEVDRETRIQISGREKLIAKLADKMDSIIKKAFDAMRIKSGYSERKGNQLRQKASNQVGVLVNSIDNARKKSELNMQSLAEKDRSKKI